MYPKKEIPLFIISAISSVVTFLAQNSAGAVMELASMSLISRIGNALTSYLKYIGKTIWPTKLAIFYPYHGLESWWIVVVAVQS